MTTRTTRPSANGASNAPPWNREAERRVLGAILSAGLPALDVVRRALCTTDFYPDAHQRIYSAALAVASAGDPIDVVSVAEELRRRGNLEDAPPAYLAELLGGEPTGANVAHHAGVVQDHARRRQLINLTRRLTDDAYAGRASGAELVQRAAEEMASLQAASANAGEVPGPLSLGDLVDKYPKLRPAAVEGLLRRGETMNVIATTKTGKSWLVVDLALAMATGAEWLGLFPTVPGNVLIIDNELHRESSSDRIRKVAEARGIALADVRERVYVQNLRGCLQDVLSLRSYFGRFKPGQFALVIIDTLYRAYPEGVSENDNAQMARVYNALDSYAGSLDCCFACIHHSSKGSQADKGVTDVGAGAGAQSRATDAHLVLRQHEEEGVFVLDAAVRSWAPLQPRCLRWEFPVWQPADDLDPELLLRPQERRKKTFVDARAREDNGALLAALDRADPERKGYGKRKLQADLGWGIDRTNATITRLHAEEVIDLLDVAYASGRGKTSTCMGVRRASPRGV